MIPGGRKHALLVFTVLLLVATFYIFYLDWQTRTRQFTLAVLDVGQGDAIFIESPSGTQVLVDGGPPRKVLGELAKVMPRFDKSLDAIIITNPDQDHIGGFLDILKTYKVGAVFESGTFNDSSTYESLKEEIEKKNIKTILARRGMRLDLGEGVMLDILFPDRDVSTWTTNDGSVVARLTYGQTSVMLMGDATEETERIIMEENSKEMLESDILKVGHHGSHTSTSGEFVEIVSPEQAVISVGESNRYGHPRQEVLDILGQSGAKILRTDESGTILFQCDTIGPCVIKTLKN